MKPVAKPLSGLIKNRARVAAILLCVALGLSLLPMMSACDAPPREGGLSAQTAPAVTQSASVTTAAGEAATTPTPYVTSSPFAPQESAPGEASGAQTPGGSSAPAGTDGGTPAPTPNGSAGFEAHFIDVGQADAILILCDGAAMLIDGGNAADSSLIYSYLQKRDIGYLDYIVCTHPDEDHVGGLSGALNYASVGTALCPVTAHDTKAFSNFVKYLDKQNVSITVPTAGDTFMLGGAFVQILGPQRSYSDTNNMSIVMKVTYGQTSFLFTGDAEEDAEHDIIGAGYDLSATVLKVGHHGSDSSTSYVWLREIMPEYAVMSVGANNSYGHPTEAVLSRLRDAGVTVYRTDMQGTVVCESDGSTVSFAVGKNENAQTNPTQGGGSGQSGGGSSQGGGSGGGGSTQKPAQTTAKPGTPTPTVIATPKPTPTPTPTPGSGGEYIGNKNSHKFHRPSCGSLPNEENRVYFATRDEAINQGYEPCKKCNP